MAYTVKMEDIPIIAPHITPLIEEDKVVLSYPKFRSLFWSKLLIPKSRSKYCRVRLDQYGSTVWRQIDGQKSIQQICDQLCSEFEFEQVDNANTRIVLFTQYLYNHQFITLL